MILDLFRPSVRFPGHLPALGVAFASPFERSYSFPLDGFPLGLLLLGYVIVSV